MNSLLVSVFAHFRNIVECDILCDIGAIVCLCIGIIIAEERLALMLTDLESKRHLLATAFAESEDMSTRILINLEKKNGLCIRCLNKQVLSLVLSFLGGNSSSVSIVCKYWLLCANEASSKTSGGAAATTDVTAKTNTAISTSTGATR